MVFAGAQQMDTPLEPGAVSIYRCSDSTMTDPTTTSQPAELHARVARVIDLMRPAIQADGGDLEFLEVTTSGVARVRLHGACVGCPSSSLTLKVGIERNLMNHIPEISGVEAIE